MAQLCETPRPTRPTRPARQTLLLVDDDAQHRELYSRRLSRLGYAVRTADCAASAIEQLALDTPDLVVLDIAMPGRDGLSALQEFIALEPTLPIIIHSAYPTFRDNFLAWAAEDYIQKSSDLGPLVSAIETALAQHAAA